LEYALLFPAASSARTRYEYGLEAASPVSFKDVPVGVAICAKLTQAVPEHRSTLYPATPTLSVDPVHVRLICEIEAAVAMRLAGAVGGVVSGAVGVVAVAVLEYALLLPAASSARTRYEYEVEAANPVSLNEVPVGAAICVKFAQAAPEQRSTLYPATPTLSVEAVQAKLICVAELAVAARLAGAVGGVVSAPAKVLSVKTFEYALLFPAASVARTRYEYEVETVNPVSLNEVPIGAAICVKFAHVAPEQRSTLYPATPTLSVEAVHVRLIDIASVAVAVKFAGAVGGVVSGLGAEDGPIRPAHPLRSSAQPAAKAIE